MSAHAVRLEQDGPNRRWTCDACPWATPWTTYTDTPAAVAAIRHVTSHAAALRSAS